MPTGAAITLGFKNDAGATATAASATLRSTFVTRIIPTLTSSVTLTTVSVKLGPEDTGPTGATVGSTNGALGLQQEQPQVALLVRKVTALGGHRGRGRMYVPGLSEGSALGTGMIVAGNLTTWQTAFTNWFNDLVTANLKPYLLHETGISATPDPTILTGFTVDPKTSTQRGRIRR